MEKLTVDIIIPVYRPDEKYIRLLQGLKKQIYPIHKIIIMNTERKYYEEDRYPQLSIWKYIIFKNQSLTMEAPETRRCNIQTVTYFLSDSRCSSSRSTSCRKYFETI